MSYRQYYDHCLQQPENAAAMRLSPQEWDQILTESVPALDRVQEKYNQGQLYPLQLATEQNDLEDLQIIANRWRAAFEHVVIFSIGGASLSAQTLCQLADCGFGPQKGAPKLHFEDNLCPHRLHQLKERLPLETTGFIILSKSGHTIEILSQFLIMLKAMFQKVGEQRIKKHFLVITDSAPSPIRRVAESHHITCLDFPEPLHGRFSCFANTTLLPALIAGLDVADFRQGGKEILYNSMEAARPEQSHPMIGAALHIGLWRFRRIRQAILMPYIAQFSRLPYWWRTLWSESLGKNGAGTTPIPALGPMDQHSQLQLFLDGPNDKFYTLIGIKASEKGLQIPDAILDGQSLDWLQDKTLGDFVHAEAKATRETLVSHQRPLRSIRCHAITEQNLGELMMHMMLETIFAAEILRLNPFDQAGVDDSKKLIRSYLETPELYEEVE